MNSPEQLNEIIDILKERMMDPTVELLLLGVWADAMTTMLLSVFFLSVSSYGFLEVYKFIKTRERLREDQVVGASMVSLAFGMVWVSAFTFFVDIKMWMSILGWPEVELAKDILKGLIK